MEATRTAETVRAEMETVRAEWANADGNVTAPAGRKQLRRLKLELIQAEAGR